MTGRSLFSRCAWLVVGLLCVAVLHAALRLISNDIATRFVRPYVPLTKEGAFTRAVQVCNQSGIRPYTENCSMPSDGSISTEMVAHKADYEYREFEPVKERIDDVTNIVLGMVYAALGLSALWAFKSWFGANIWPMLAGFVRPLRASLDLSERGASWRLRRAEKEFRTLKSLHDDGLISEDVFVTRRNKLMAAIKAGPKGKS